MKPTIVALAVLGTALALGQRLVEADSLKTLKVENVCIGRLPGYTYSVSPVADFKLVHVFKRKEEVFSVYVGYNPQLEGVNIKYRGRALLAKMKNQTVRLESPQSGEVLGIPDNPKDRFFHIIVSSRAADYSVIVRSVTFCSS